MCELVANFLGFRPLKASHQSAIVVSMFGLLLFAACSPVPLDNGPTPWTYDARQQGGSPIEISALDAGFSALVEGLSRIDPMVAHAGHGWAMGYRDSSCPLMDEHNGQELWWGDCRTESGSLFQGFSLYTQVRGMPASQGYVDHYYWNHSHMMVQPDDGDTYLALGDNEVTGTRYDNGDRLQTVTLLGDYRWTHRAADDTWMQDDLSLTLDLRAEQARGLHSLRMTGGASRLPGLFVATELNGLFLNEDPSGCALEPEGSLEVWEAQAGWYSVEFDAGQGGACDGCGTVSWEGDVLGEVCADFSPWLVWSGDWKW